MMRLRNKTNEIKTDAVNSGAISVKLGDLDFILPPNSVIETGKTLRIKQKGASKCRNRTVEKALFEAVKHCGDFDAVLISGGIDSSVLAVMAKTIRKDCAFISVGFEDSEDIKYARILCERLKVPMSAVIIRNEDVLDAVNSLKRMNLDTYNIILGVVEYIAVSYARSKGYHRVVSGLGSDELFFGFRRHKDLAKGALTEYRLSRLFYLSATDLLRIRILSEHTGVNILTPYLDDSVIKSALRLNVDRMRNNSGSKIIIRRIGKKLGLGNLLSSRHKRAMQYGSGVIKSLERLSKMDKIKNVGDFINSI
ncbi:MAG: asparagine synthase-related protein [Candidatus Parvarchaeota archaeon]|nr:asparagine synthase-related protein [Candidatus Parvarchaeota archaeon]MCL5101424.1 asparagine synthase-related protein [Candidatus Parvarchaeota archaeon]